MNSNLDPSGSHLSKVEKDLENVLRPDAFSSFAGQEKVVENLRVFVRAAAQRGEALDHPLLYGRDWAKPRYRTSLLTSWAST